MGEILIPRFALLCCCCCTHAELVGKNMAEVASHVHTNGIIRREGSVGENFGADNFYQPYSKQDVGHDNFEDESESENNAWTKGQAYGYGTLANFFLTMSSLSGLTIVIYVQKCKPAGSDYIFDTFLSLASSTMLGDAFFHTLPVVLGLHSHDHTESNEERSEEVYDEHKEYVRNLGKIAVIIGTLLSFWAFETVLNVMGLKEGHSHAHGENSAEHEDSEENSGNVFDSASRGKIKWDSVIGIVIGDTIHRFLDGVAMGVSWAVNWTTGLATTIAILLHEVPHELGDFVIYRKFGLSNKQALLVNLGSACCSYGGLYLGLTLAAESDVSQWMLAAVTGLFVHISLVDIMTEMKIEKTAKNGWLRFSIQLGGMITGFAIMALISVYEEDIGSNF